MSITLIDGFINTAALPVDLKSVWASTSSLYTSSAGGFISSSWRYVGMTVYCQDASSSYQLIDGVVDANWVKLTTGSNYISSSYALTSSYTLTASFVSGSSGNAASASYA